MLIDSHAHINFPGFNEFDFAGVSKIVVVGTSIEDSEKAIEMAGRHGGLFPTVGIHPNDDPKSKVETIDWEKFEFLAKKSVAIGECGLDYSRSKDSERQIKLFERQIEIAEKYNLPLILHIRDAQEELISIFGHKLAKLKGVFHCFSGDVNYLNTIIKLMPGFYISFAGNVTFKNAQGLRDLAKAAPIERILVETDSPFLTPEPHRGKPNSPENVKIVAEKLAEVKGMSFEEICKQTTINTETLFKI